MCCEARVPAFLLPLLMVYDHEGTNHDLLADHARMCVGFCFVRTGIWKRNADRDRWKSAVETFEGMVKRWKRNSQTVVAEFKRRRYYQPPSEQRRLAKAKAEKRARRAQMKRERAERRNG